MTWSLHRRSLARWIAGGLIALIALIQAGRTVAAPGHLSSLGGLAIAALGVLTVFGMLGLLRARLRIEGELVAIAQKPPCGSLVAARRERLAHIAAGGGRPDPAALAEEAAAAERGHAYLGRYLVAVAVLIGLVGTFSGLAEALRALPTIFSGAAGDPQRLAELMSTSVSGLDLTFAAGIIGILTTLSLALVQGDLQVHEELALARLEEETAHELIPALWPRAHAVEERMVRELATLRQEASAMRAIVAETGSTLGAAVAAELGRGMKELLQQQAETARAIDRQTETARQALLATAERQADAAAAGWRALRDALAPVLDDAARRLADSAADLSAAATAQLVATREAISSTANQASASLGVAIAETSAQIAAQLAAVHAEVGAQAEATQSALAEAAARQADAAGEGWRSVRDAIVPALEDARIALDTSVLSAVATLEETAGETARRLGEATAAFAATAGVELSSTRQALTAAAERSALAIGDAGDRAAASLDGASLRCAAAITEASQRSAEVVATASERNAEVVSEAARRSVEAVSAAAERAATAISTASHHGAEAVSAATALNAEVLQLAIERGAGSISSAADRTAELFVKPATQLAESANLLAHTQAALAPQLEALVPELRTLGQEVALLGARPEATDEKPLFADELVRLGEGMARLEGLVQLAQPRGRKGAQG
jgi:hypothetical protein